MKKLMIVFAMFGLLSGCGPLPPLETPFNRADFEPYKATGTCAVSGQAFLKTRGGDVKYGAGNTVRLIPHTEIIKEMYDRQKHFRFFQMPDAETMNYIKSTFRETVADGNGNFEFRDIPPGEYLLECEIRWQVLNSTTGGIAKAVVNLKEGESRKVVLTDQ